MKTSTLKKLTGMVVLGGSALLMGCESTMNTTGSLDAVEPTANHNSQSVLTLMSTATTTAANDGLNQLDISDVDASGFVTAGTGTASRQPEQISIEVPSDATVEAVFLYWARLDNDLDYSPQAPSTITVDGTEYTGVVAGGPIDNPNIFYPLESKAGITHKLNLTAANLISSGTNTITVLDDPVESGEPLGASLIVFYSLDDQPGELYLFDGADYIWADAAGETLEQRLALSSARPVIFTFEPADQDRTADLALFIGDVEPEDASERPNSLNITMGDGPVQVIGPDPSPFQGFQGPEWDNYEQSLTIPAGVGRITVEPVSGPGENPASLLWALAGLSIANPDMPPKCECKGDLKKLTLKYSGKRKAKITVKQKNGKVVYNGYVKPQETFSFRGRYRDGTLGSEIKVYVNWKKDTSIKTDCSLYPGQKQGSFLVVKGYDKNGNEICQDKPGKCSDYKGRKKDCDKDRKWDKDHKWDKKDKWNKYNDKNRWGKNKKNKSSNRWW